MSKKVKVLISVVVAVFLLTIGTTAVVMAQEEPAPEPRANGLLARVADKLGISQEELTDAFNQARQEMGQEMRQDCPSDGSGLGDGNMWNNGNMWNKRWHSAFGMRGDGGGWHWQGQCQQGNGA